MLKLFRYLKKSIIPILAIIALLVVQAVCDLTLPDYTAKIINVGIQQNGIESAVPQYISKTTMDHILLLMDEEQQDIVVQNYTELSAEEFQQTRYFDHALWNEKISFYEGTQPEDMTEEQWNEAIASFEALKKETIFKLNNLDETQLEELEEMIAKPMILVKYIMDDADLASLENAEDSEYADQFSELLAQLPPEAMQENLTVWELLEMMNAEQRTQIISAINEQFNDMSDNTLNQTAISAVKAEYDAIILLDAGSMQIHYILIAGLQMLAIAVISMLAVIIVVLLASRIAAALSQEVRGRIFKKVISFSNTEMDQFSTASLITRSTNDIQQIQLTMVMMLRMIFYAPIIGLGGVLKVINTNSSMSWVIAVAVGSIMTLVIVMFTVAMPKFKRMQVLVDKLNLVTREILTGLPVIRAFHTEKHEEKRFEEANTDLTKNQLFVNRIMSCMMPAMMFIMNGISVLVVWIGGHSVDAGAMQVGDMMAVIQYVMQIIMAFLMISIVAVMVPRASVAANRINDVLKTNLSIKDTEHPVLTEDVQGRIEFNNVSFRYPNAEEDVLKDISFTARSGETTAIIGSTGSGKSTLINLIPRFYDVTGGSIQLDDHDVRQIAQKDLREHIGYVPQKGMLFSGTVESNINYGVPEETIENAKQAAEVAQAAEFVTNLTGEYDYEIAQGGTNVSGGQKQRLSIARAVAKRPAVYLFDDSFSALDFKTDIALRRALSKYTKQSTVLIVAQRISTILNAEQIIVLDEGQIVGRGTHKELLKTCEVYHQIAESQLSKEELDHE